MTGCSIQGGTIPTESPQDDTLDTFETIDPNDFDETNLLSVSMEEVQVLSYEDGDEALVIDMLFTNNSDSTTSFSSNYNVNAFQNGVALEYWYIGIDYDPSLNFRDIQPGTTITVQVAFALDDESEVIVDLEEIWTEEIAASWTITP